MSEENKLNNVDALVKERWQWNDELRIASVKMQDLVFVHWFSASERAPHDFLCAYVSCERIVNDELAHSCLHGDGPLIFRVVIANEDNDKVIFEELRRDANAEADRWRDPLM